MATKQQLMSAIQRYIANDMIPKATGNYKVILNIARSAIAVNPDAVYSAIQNNPLFAMLGIIDGENFNADVAAKVLVDGMGSDEFTFGFHLLGKDYTFYFTSADVQAIKDYL